MQPLPAPSAEPAYETDTPLAFLNTAELLLLTTTRLWMAHFFDPEAGHRPWRSGFAVARLEAGAAQAFDEFWRIVAVAPRKQLDLRCTACPGLGEDEGHLLQAVHALQCGQRGLAQGLLAAWMPPSALRIARSALEIVASAFASAGLTLPDRRAMPAGAAAGQLAAICPDRGLALMH